MYDWLTWFFDTRPSRDSVGEGYSLLLGDPTLEYGQEAKLGGHRPSDKTALADA